LKNKEMITMLFEIKSKKVSIVEESHFDLEKDIQNLI